MLLDKINSSKYSKVQLSINDLNDYIIQVDYFDQRGTKNNENKIPLKNMIASVISNSKNILKY